MESALLRFFILLLLFFLLAGDFGSFLSPVLQVLQGGSTAETGAETAGRRGHSQEADSKDPESSLDDSLEVFASSSKSKLLSTIKNSCLPKLICELNASRHKEKLSDSEKSLLSLIRDTSISVTAEVTSKYHFAAHMGQLIAGVDGAGCHNFYPNCPFPGMQVLHMMKKVRLR